MSFVHINNIVKSYDNNIVLKNVFLNLERGEQVILQGPSGSGKSTLLYLLGGMDAANSGEIIVDTLNISRLDDAGLAKYRNQDVGFVFQFHYLLNSLNCLENILMSARIGSANISEVKKRIYLFAKEVGVSEYLNKFPHQLSGGEQQRVNLLRAISLSPKLILCDEPTGNLDSHNSVIVINLLKKLALETRACLLVVTHDQEVSKQFNKHFTIVDGIINNALN